MKAGTAARLGFFVLCSVACVLMAAGFSSAALIVNITFDGSGSDMANWANNDINCTMTADGDGGRITGGRCKTSPCFYNDGGGLGDYLECFNPAYNWGNWTGGTLCFWTNHTYSDGDFYSKASSFVMNKNTGKAQATFDGASISATSATSINDGLWNHVCVVKSHGNVTLVVYVNGVKDGVAVGGDCTGDLASESGSTYIAVRSPGSGSEGKWMDDVLLWTDTLTDSLVAQVYADAGGETTTTTTATTTTTEETTSSSSTTTTSAESSSSSTSSTSTTSSLPECSQPEMTDLCMTLNETDCEDYTMNFTDTYYTCEWVDMEGFICWPMEMCALSASPTTTVPVTLNESLLTAIGALPLIALAMASLVLIIGAAIGIVILFMLIVWVKDVIYIPLDSVKGAIKKIRE